MLRNLVDYEEDYLEPTIWPYTLAFLPVFQQTDRSTYLEDKADVVRSTRPNNYSLGFRVNKIL